MLVTLEHIDQFDDLRTHNKALQSLDLVDRIPLALDQLHVDLRYPLRRLGLSGGLKHVEGLVGLKRDPEVAGLDGWDAVRLWREYQAGSDKSLATLIKYNTADIENLEHLMLIAYEGMRREAGLPIIRAGWGSSQTTPAVEEGTRYA